MRKVIFAAVMMMAISTIARADGLLVIRPIPGMPEIQRVDVRYHHVDVDINDPAANTIVDQVFFNPYYRELEADYIFPIPENAVVSNFTAWLGGKKMQAELLDANQARRIYEDIVRHRKDPALLEYAGRGMYRMRVYPIPPHGEVRIKIEYQQTLKTENGVVEYLYPLNTEKYSGANLNDCRISVNIKSFDKIGSVYCPTHIISSERLNEKSMKAVYYQENVKPDKDFILHFSRQNNDFGFHLLSYKEPWENSGYFVGLISPPVGEDQPDINKNLIFLLDSSGSMRGEKISQAIDALKFCLRGLKSGDRFNIIDYSDNVRPYMSNMITAGKGDINDAIKFADRIESSGGTNIYDALDTACRMIPSNGNPTYIVFLTDGLPTVGNTDINRIIENTGMVNEGRARLFVFGVGFDVNAHLLDRLVEQNGGAAEYVSPDENIEVKVSSLAKKISSPALSGLSLSFSSDRISYVYPEPLPDLFNGSEIIIVGKFDHVGQTTATLKGKIGKKDVVYEYPVKFSDGSRSDEYIAMLWANRRIAFLLQQMRLHGTSDELLSEVVLLSKKFGIITEYTSYLVAGDENRRFEDYMYMRPEASAGRLKKSMVKLGQMQSGESAFNQSKNLGNQSYSPQVPQSGEVMIGDKKQRFSNVAQVGNQAFFQSGQNWIQSDLTEDRYDIAIKPFSTAYFQILEKDPSLGRIMSLGDEVRFAIGNQIVQIAESGRDSLSPSELINLFSN